MSTVEEVLRGDPGSKVLTSISTSSSSSSSSGSASSSSASASGTGTGTATATATGGGGAYGEETSPYDNYDSYGNYETYYDESTSAPDGDDSRRVTITDIGTGGSLDLGAGGKIELGAGTGVISSGVGTSITINKTSVGGH